MKRFLLPLILLIPKLPHAQSTHDHVLAIQSEIMPMNTPYHVHSVMFGMKTGSGDQYLIGPAFKTFMTNVGHKKSSVGLKLHTHVQIGRFSPFLSYEMMWGEYYVFGAEADKGVAVKSRKQGKGVLGLGYAITDKVSVFAGATAQDYHPMNYYQSKKTPYTNGSMVVKLSADVWTLFSN